MSGSSMVTMGISEQVEDEVTEAGVQGRGDDVDKLVVGHDPLGGDQVVVGFDPGCEVGLGPRSRSMERRSSSRRARL